MCSPRAMVKAAPNDQYELVSWQTDITTQVLLICTELSLSAEKRI